MNWANILRRWTMRSIHGAVLGAALLGSLHAASAQPTAPPASASNATGKHYSKSLTFKLPVRIDDPSFRASLSEVRLFIKAPGAQWRMQENGSSQTEEFHCRVPQDGEYWYTLVTVDRAGRPSIPDVNLEPPSMRIVVDTAAPQIEIQAANTLDGELCLRCAVNDAHPDLSTLRAICRTEFGDTPLEQIPGQPGSFRVKGPEMLRYPVVVSVMDMARNLGSKEISLREMLGSTLTPAPAPTPGAAPTPPVDIALMGIRPDWKGPGPQLGGESNVQKTEASIPAKNDGPGSDGSHRVELPPRPIAPPAPPASNPKNPPAITQPAPSVPNPPIAMPPMGLDLATKPSATPPEPAQRSGVPHQLINTTHATIEYRIDQVGASGIGKVEVYMTPDNGQSWHRLGEDTDKTSPANMNLPGDGVYGIRIVVSNGNGFGGKAPVRGDAPHCTVEVDTTTPFVQLRTAEVVASSGHVELRWNATDKNLGSESVSLSYRTSPTGPWQAIAKNVKNDGLYRWNFPRDAGGQFFFKIEVADQAGNVAQDVSRQPVVIDVTEPRATVVGVSGSGAPRTANGGN